MAIRPFMCITVIAYCMVVLCLAPGAFGQSSPQKPRIAVKQAAIGEGVSQYAEEHLNLETILAEMESSLRATRKFEVLTRQKENLEDIRDEQKFSQSDLTKGDAASSGLLENADYLVRPTVQDFKFYRTSKPVPNISNKYVRNDGGMLEIQVQVLDTETGGIKGTFYLKDSFYTADKVVNTKGGAPSSVYFTRMAKDVSSQMADQLVDTVFPMLVLQAASGQIFINRGKDGGLEKGDVLNAYRPGEALIDPYTGENLGTAERKVGKVKVTRVNPKFTIAEPMAKEVKEPIQKGDILRKP